MHFVPTEEEPKIEFNPYANKTYSHKYYELLETRKKLPVFQHKTEILQSVLNNKVTIIEGNTGSGKTTQIPQFLLESGILNPQKKIICSQPRRVAAINIANRVSEEIDCDLGSIVGYSVRFENVTTNKTKLIYMTDGLLLREFISDPIINKYGIVIIDEAHERTINTDIILGLLKQALEKRDDLKVVVMSATIEASKFANFFTINEKTPPHLQIPGKLFPVDIIYTDSDVSNYNEKAIEVCLNIHSNEPSGDILIFLTGEDEIENCCSILREKAKASQARGCIIKDVNVLPLYASLPLEEQEKVFMKHDKSIRKIIVSTNIAETSLTIEGIVYVIDSGLVKQTLYNPIKRMSSLQVTNISKASAIQRSGRAGRTQQGKCYRLYTEDSFNNVLPEQTAPEISRSDLAAVLLLMLAIGIKDLVKFPYIDKPHKKLLISAIEELHFLGALNSNSELTEEGRLMSQIPLEPGLSSALIKSKDFGCTKEIAALSSILSQQGQVFIRPRNAKKEANIAHSQFKDLVSDHISLLTTFEAFSLYKSREWCEQNFLNFRVLDGALKSQGQLISLLQKLNIPIPSVSRINPQRNMIILQALLQGMFMNIAVSDQNNQNEYIFMKNSSSAQIYRTSVLWGKQPKWVLFSDYVFTDRDYIRTVSQIDPKWIIPAAESYFTLERATEEKFKVELRRLILQYKQSIF